MSASDSTNYDDPVIEERWCAEQRNQVIEYLVREAVAHGRVGEWPAWHVAPYAAIWAIESKSLPGTVGWWVICGDLPTDYISGNGNPHPRNAMQAIAERWHEAAELMSQGKTPSGFSIGSPSESLELAPLLAARAELLSKWADDPEIWNKSN